MKTENELIDELRIKNPDATPELLAKLAKNMIRNRNKRQERKETKRRGFKEVASTISLAAITNPKFWEQVGSLITKINHPEWYGGNSNTFTGPVGPYINPPQGKTIIFANSIIEVDPTKMIDLSMIETQFSAAVIAFNKRLGFSSGLTTKHITDYMKAAINYLAMFKTIRRISSYANVPIVKDIKLGDKWDATAIQGIQHDTTGDYMMFLKGSKTIKLPNISNYAWQTEYVDPALTILLMPQHEAFLSYIFDPLWSNGIDSGANTFWEFLPIWREHPDAYSLKEVINTTNIESFLKERLDTALDGFTTAKAANPYIETFLMNIGFTHIVDANSTHRDPVAQAVIIAHDPTIKSSLTNSFNLDLETNGLMVQYSTDIDPTFETTFGDLSIGDIGRESKFYIMGAEMVAYQSLMLFRTSSSGSVSMVWNKPLFAINASTNYFRVGPRVENLLIDSGYTPTTAERGTLSAVLQMISIEDYMTLEHFNFKIDQLYLESGGRGFKFMKTSSADTVQLAGTDILQISDIKLALQVVKVNFTLGSDYLSKLSQVVKTATAALTLR